MNDILTLLWICPIACLIQVIAALPWLYVLDPEFLKSRFQGLKNFLQVIGGIVGVGWILAGFFYFNSDPGVLAGYGRIFAALLLVQLIADFFVIVFFLLLLLWPKGGAVALAAFRESVRQPTFWILTIAGILLLVISPFLPYFTFGEDLKMLKDLGYLTIMFVSVVFAILSASVSISEEIEGRTAVTVISKPVSRRHFLLGKFGGFMLAALLMTAILGWLYVWVVLFKQWWEPEIGNVEEPDPLWVQQIITSVFSPGAAQDLFRGIMLWTNDYGQALPGFVITFGHVIILLAISVALATRVPMIVNIILCITIYFLGHLTTILTAVTEKDYRLVYFVAQVFDTILPGLDHFDMGPAVVRDVPLPATGFFLYTVNVTTYAVIYTAIALLVGLVFFEDRDLA